MRPRRAGWPIAWAFSFFVEARGRLVDQEDGDSGGDRARDRDPFALAGREVGGAVVGAFGEPDLPERLTRVGSKRERSLVRRRVLSSNVLEGRQVRDEAGFLGDECDRAAAEVGKLRPRLAGRASITRRP